ncbi:MAG: sugar phosphate isomerase/epimerase [Candidatus Solibacter usitatus]|nr:sugar phosphate isomerase/epimerase [Candidatus Solibacter usitatus]
MTRRELLAGTLAASALAARNKIDRTRISAITDEIAVSPEDAIAFALQYKLQWVELRAVPGKKGAEYAFMPEAEVKAAAAAFKRNGLGVSFLNSSLLKFPWPGTEPARQRQETPEARAKRLERESARFNQRMDDLRKALNAAHILEVDKVRVFTGTRVAEPGKLFPRIIDVLGEMAFAAEKEKVHLLIENEGSCNVATSAEVAELLQGLSSKWIGINWDPLNETGHQEVPFPDGYNRLPKKRIGNVQIKGKSLLDDQQRLDWKAIFASLVKDGYAGKVGLETHYFDGTLIEKSHLSMREILRIAES